MSQQTSTPSTPVTLDENQLMAERRDKLKALRVQQAQGQGVAFPNDCKPADRAAAYHPASVFVLAAPVEFHKRRPAV